MLISSNDYIHQCLQYSMNTTQQTKSDKPKAESIITKYTKQQDNILIEIEDALIQQTPSLKTNVQKLGMKMKIIYQCMPTGVKSTSAKIQDDGMVI